LDKREDGAAGADSRQRALGAALAFETLRRPRRAAPEEWKARFCGFATHPDLLVRPAGAAERSRHCRRFRPAN
jgi:hypothetical protein